MSPCCLVLCMLQVGVGSSHNCMGQHTAAQLNPAGVPSHLEVAQVAAGGTVCCPAVKAEHGPPELPLILLGSITAAVIPGQVPLIAGVTCHHAAAAVAAGAAGCLCWDWQVVWVLSPGVPGGQGLLLLVAADGCQA